MGWMQDLEDRSREQVTLTVSRSHMWMVAEALADARDVAQRMLNVHQDDDHIRQRVESLDALWRQARGRAMTVGVGEERS